MKVVIMAGGKGTRISEINSEVPKPMIKILGKPILEYQIDVLKEQGCTDIIIVVGHLGNIIKEHFGDGCGRNSKTGKKYGVNISYIQEDEPLGTAGALYLLKEELNEDFLLLNGDIIFDIDINRFYEFHKNKSSIATLFTHPNSHPFDSGIIFADNNSLVIDWLHKEDYRQWYKNRVNAGIHMLSPRIFELMEERGIFKRLMKVDLDRDVLKPLINNRCMYAYDSPEYVKDMGTPERFRSVSLDIKRGKVKNKNLKVKQKAIFLDRDGTINQYVGFLRNINDFNLIPGVEKAIREINESEYLAIVITNQPVVARGEVTFSELKEIHNKMETLLGREGAYIDGIYFCPHHPHRGFLGEIQELKIDCECRKPKAGLLFQAAIEFNIDLEESWMVGDSNSDIEAGQNAGCKTIFLGEKKENICSLNNLAEAIEFIIGGKTFGAE